MRGVNSLVDFVRVLCVQQGNNKKRGVRESVLIGAIFYVTIMYERFKSDYTLRKRKESKEAIFSERLWLWAS